MNGVNIMNENTLSLSTDLTLEWDDIIETDSIAEYEHTDSISDALILSLSNFACVDIEYISAITGKDYTTVINALKGSIFQNPETWEECEYKGWETAEEYLSGNLSHKLNVAKDANELPLIKPKGGGGTRFDIMFEYVNKFMSDDLPVSIIILTDGYAKFPNQELANNIPVLWLLNNDYVQPPWGKVARINVPAD